MFEHARDWNALLDCWAHPFPLPRTTQDAAARRVAVSLNLRHGWRAAQTLTRPSWNVAEAGGAGEAWVAG
jgi:hypothetical protein